MPRIIAHPIEPPACRCRCSVLVVHFAGDEAHVYPTTDNPGELAARLARLVADLIEHPGAVPVAAGVELAHSTIATRRT
jgi:hypothetical protein